MYDFKLDSTTGKPMSLEDFKGQYLVLYFYPKDNTSGWTNQAKEFAKLYDEFKAFDAEIVGVSKDSIRTHINFKEKHNLPFILLSDPDREVHKQFEVLKPKKMYGKDVIGTIRSTFVFDKDGKLIKEFRNVKATENPAEVLEYIKQLNV